METPRAGSHRVAGGPADAVLDLLCAAEFDCESTAEVRCRNTAVHRKATRKAFPRAERAECLRRPTHSSSAIAARKNLPARSGCARRWRSVTTITAKGNYAQARQMARACQGRSLLADYALYWLRKPISRRATAPTRSRNSSGFAVNIPDSVMTEQALQSLGDAALAANQPAEAVAALDAYSSNDSAARAAAFARRGSRAGTGSRWTPPPITGALHALRHQRAGRAGRRQARFPASAASARNYPASLARSTASPMPPCSSTRRDWTTRATNTPQLLPNFPAPIASARNCAFSSAVWPGRGTRRNGRAANHRSRCGCRAL